MRRIRMSNDTIDQCVSEFKSFLQSEKGIKRGKNFEYQVLPPKVEGESKATVTFSERAYSKIILLLEAFNEEVAWHGVASRIEKGQYRIDDIIVFAHLNKEEIREIVDLMLNDLFKRLNERQLKIEVTDAAKDYLAKEGYSETYGARPLRRVIQKKVEDVLAEEILTGNYQPNDDLVMDMKDDKIVIEKKQ